MQIKLSNDELNEMELAARMKHEFVPRGMPVPGWLTDQIRLHEHIAAQTAEIEALRTDLELLVKIACREQRYECVDALRGESSDYRNFVQNALCPNVDTVIGLWGKVKEKNDA